MKYSLRVLIIFLGISLGIIAAGKYPVLAQDGEGVTGFHDVELWVYPEYDDPRLLVMMEGHIDGAQAPAEVRFLVPSAAEMYSAGSMDAQGEYSGGPPHREPSSIPGWDEISYTVNTDTFRVEYYDPIIMGLPDKTISYEFRSLYPIAGLDVVVQQPLKAGNFSVLPAGEPFVSSKGFNNYRYNYDSLDNSSTLKFQISYYKPDSTPSLSAEDNTGSGLNSTAIIITLAVLGFAGIMIFVLRRMSRPNNRAARRRREGSAPKREPSGEKSATRFCDQCGEPVKSSSRFCPNCGSKI